MICTALQLTNFWQDIRTDYTRGRIYLPIEEMSGHGADEQALIDGQITTAWRNALGAAVGY